MKIKNLMKTVVVFFILVTVFSITQTSANGPKKYVSVYLADQVLYCYQDGIQIYTMEISSGRQECPTPTGKFYIWSMDKKIINTNGILMEYCCWLTIGGKVKSLAIHKGNTSSMNASGGCVRLNEYDSWVFYNKFADVGLPVIINP